MPGPDFSLERELIALGRTRPCGVDEAGRGPLAGPVIAAAVILDPARIPAGLNDSKKLSPARRDALFMEIVATSLVGVGAASSAEIDATDIRKATLLAMLRAVQALPCVPDHALVDGRDIPPGLPCAGRAVVKGDQISCSVAAASIVAKRSHTALMQLADRTHPGYGFAVHSGYGTAAHLAAISSLGPAPIHRLSFRPLREA